MQVCSARRGEEDACAMRRSSELAAVVASLQKSSLCSRVGIT